MLKLWWPLQSWICKQMKVMYLPNKALYSLITNIFCHKIIHMMSYFLSCYVCIAAGIRRGMEKMQKAFEIYPYCPMALNHLANHFFFTGQHFLVEQLTETALAVSNNPIMKAHSYYNLARSYHSKVKHSYYFMTGTVNCVF